MPLTVLWSQYTCALAVAQQRATLAWAATLNSLQRLISIDRIVKPSSCIHLPNYVRTAKKRSKLYLILQSDLTTDGTENSIGGESKVTLVWVLVSSFIE